MSFKQSGNMYRGRKDRFCNVDAFAIRIKVRKLIIFLYPFKIEAISDYYMLLIAFYK